MKIETKNSILCSYIKLIPYKGGLLAVYEDWDRNNCPQEKVLCYHNQNNTIASTSEMRGYSTRYGKEWDKVLAASPSLSLPVWELPERDKFMPKELLEVEHKKYRDEHRETTSGHWQTYVLGLDAGYHAARKSYSEQDFKKFLYWLDANVRTNDDEIVIYPNGKAPTKDELINEFLFSLHPKGIWAEVISDNTAHDIDQVINYSGDEKYKFKITGNKLIVIEWE